jgi:hypothetical protein
MGQIVTWLLDGVPEAVRPAVATALFGTFIAGVIVAGATAWFAYLREMMLRRKAHADEQADQQSKALRAIHAEIASKLLTTAGSFESLSDHRVKTFCDRMRDAERQFGFYHPYFAVEPYTAPVYDTYADRLWLLDQTLIGPVIDFYRTDQALHGAFESFASDAAKALSAERRITLLGYLQGVFREYVEIGLWTYHLLDPRWRDDTVIALKGSRARDAYFKRRQDELKRLEELALLQPSHTPLSESEFIEIWFESP